MERIRDEEQDVYSDDSLFNIRPWGADLSFRELIQRYDDDELVKPELQRNYVWDRVEASRFVDSLLLGLPVPSIFLAQTPDEKLLLIDGYQRLLSVRDYVRGIFSRDGKSFSLSRTEKINARWRGKAFGELSDAEQRRIKNTTIHAIIFAQQKEPQVEDTSLFQVFERINTSGRTLLAQEIRNCVAQGALNDLLFDLNGNENWRVLFGSAEADSRMRDMEQILRFFALGSDDMRNANREKLSLRQFLDQYMAKHAKIDGVEARVWAQRFEKVVEKCFEWFGESAFHNLSKTGTHRYTQKFSPTIFDSVAIATEHALNNGVLCPDGDPVAARNLLLQDHEYIEAITKETMRKSSINLRISKACAYLFNIEYEQR